jgi:hypothetical protein
MDDFYSMLSDFNSLIISYDNLYNAYENDLIDLYNFTGDKIASIEGS